ncbi:ROK family transcriptional regulator [Actinoplanes sp. KI2]|uniref:ROK family transcriptional regulator n=1 Tax=Actinoplanes sp. KI2 TaxID=2983315 RepID=UPI0021D58FD2|nr:ROK family transcriptional regulator [Actinoplanes sp. KI2]MCU7726487.1 ROK family transcriptional regulator [Actinoplanes sp. KI2]
MEPTKPSQDLVRALTDEHVLRALMRHRRLTRAELAVEIGISKPTAGESVRRLTERGLVADTGERTPGGRGRGRVGSYYAIAPTAGVALAITISPAGVVAECIDVYGDTVARAVRQVDRTTWPRQVAAALQETVAEAAPGHSPVRLAVIGAADPVDRATGRLVHLPDSPFLVGELDPAALLAPIDVVVDNDVNWAALAEPEHARDFAYLYLGDGLGCAIVTDGAVRRGHSGLAGEIGHLLTTGPGGRSMPFIEVFGALGLRRPNSTAIDVDWLRYADQNGREAIGLAVSGVLAAIVALVDPREIVIGGTWGPALIDEIGKAAARMPRPVPLRPATTGIGDPVMAGVRAEALDRLRASLTA